MPTWTLEQLRDYERRHNSNKSSASAPVPQPAIRHEPVGEKAGEAGNTGRFLVRITSYRRRLCDIDNLCPKYFIDCLRYANLIPDDSPEYITLSVNQVKASSYAEEQTVIEIERLL